MSKKPTKNKYTKYVNHTKKMAERPPNDANPDRLAEEMGHSYDEEYFPLLTAVGRTAAYNTTGNMVHIEHKSETDNDGPVVFIGKGITFDTGGLNIKTRGMEEMKFDKCGAMSVWSTLKYAEDNKSKTHVIGIMPLAENNVGSTTLKPSSVIKSYGGLKVEVTDTDAEGRLILADAISYALTFKPRLIVTVATLTGGCAHALGEHYTGLFGNPGGILKYKDILKYLGSKCDTSLWHMPMDPVHVEDVRKTRMADVRNYTGKEHGGSTAAAFLYCFVENKVPWLHLDIAGTAWKKDKATGKPTELLCRFIDYLDEGLEQETLALGRE